MRRISIILLLSSAFYVLISFFSLSQDTVIIEMMINIENQQEAYTLAYQYDIDLTSYSDFGYAVFDVPSYQKDELLQAGFSENQTLEQMGRFDQITSDPLVTDQYALSLMHVTEAWSLTEGSADVVVAIIDTGIDTDHDEFIGRILQTSYNARTKTTSETSLSHIEDDNGHGTMVAGIIGANKNNNKGIAGIVSNVKLLVIKANNSDNPLTEEDESDQFLESSIADAIHYARMQGADIINMSLGTKSINTVTQSAVEQAIAEGIIIVGASGNDGDTSKYYPASYPGVISVASIDESLSMSSFSNFNDAVDITAPGSSIVSTSLNNGYATGSGTSFAAPQIAGVLALMKSHFITMTSDQIISQIMSTAISKSFTWNDNTVISSIVQADAAMQVDYVTVTFETNEGILIDSISVVEGFSFDAPEATKEGYLFIGWYYDSQLTDLYEDGVDVINSNITLYAKYEPTQLNVSFYRDGVLISQSQIYYSEIITLPDPQEVTGYDFIGWYYDLAYTTPYVDEPIYEDTILYARYERRTYTITYIVNGETYQTDEYLYQAIPDTPTPESELVFLGWYLDSNFVSIYQIEPITASFNLYARFHDGLYTVTFFDADLITVISTQQIPYGGTVLEPNHPTKENSPSFSYTFIGWSESFDFITEDIHIYPEYDMTFLPESISLQPGVDTVSNFDEWEDASIVLLDQLLTKETFITEVDDMTYQIVYNILLGDEIIDTKYRMVSVIQEERVTITLLPDVTTLKVGDDYEDAGATSNLGEIEVEGQVDTSTPGVYEIIYRVNYEGHIYQKTRYVYVLDNIAYHPEIIVYYRKEEGVYL
jgi:uncharacterized repeat protein (TIGR02543 family)